MTLLCPNRTKPTVAADYATSDDFRKSFAEDTDALHMLAYLVTGNHENSEQSLVTGLEDCVDNNFVFKEWACSWTQRTIVQCAIRMISPRPNHAAWTRVSRRLQTFKTLKQNMPRSRPCSPLETSSVSSCPVCTRGVFRSGLCCSSKLFARGS